tara:strand:- start:14 stop:265 length:252 start_codon:yes stop_codon:yes gene_type:complete
MTKYINNIDAEIHRRYIKKVKEQTEDFSRDELVKEIARLHQCCDDMNSMHSCGDGYDYIGLSYDDAEELKNKKYHSYKRLERI